MTYLDVDRISVLHFLVEDVLASCGSTNFHHHHSTRWIRQWQTTSSLAAVSRFLLATHALWLVGLRYNNKSNVQYSITNIYLEMDAGTNACHLWTSLWKWHLSLIEIVDMKTLFLSMHSQAKPLRARAWHYFSSACHDAANHRKRSQNPPDNNQSITKREGLYHQFIYLHRNFRYCHVQVSYIPTKLLSNPNANLL